MKRLTRTYSLLGAFVICMIVMGMFPTVFIVDDAYFYLEIARNFADGHGITFNRIVPTNGFHPLWHFALAPCAWFTSSSASYLRAVVLASALFGVGSYLLICAVIRSISHERVAIIALIPPFFTLGGLLLLGSEAFINAFFIALALYVSFAYKKSSYLSFVLRGIIFGALMLARLDNVFLAGALCVYFSYKFDLKRAFGVFVAASLVVAPYLAWNEIVFGHFVPIHGAMKSSFPIIGPNVGEIFKVHYLLLGIAIATILTPLIPRVKVHPSKYKIILTLSGTALVHGMYHFLFQKVAFWHWYIVLPSILVGVSTSLVVDEIFDDLFDASAFDRMTLGVSVIASLFLVSFTWGYMTMYRSPRLTMWVERASQSLNQVLTDEDIILVNDMPGAVQFWTDAKVLADDGLTTNMRFHRKLVREKDTFVKELGVTHVLLRLHPDDHLSDYCTDDDKSCRTIAPFRYELGNLGLIVHESNRVFEYRKRMGEGPGVIVWEWDGS